MDAAKIDIHIDGNLIVFRPNGAFEMHNAVEYEESFANIVSQLNGQSWGLLSIYGEIASADPQVQQRVWEQLNWCIHQGCDYIGFVVGNEFQQRLVDEVTKNLPVKDLQTFSDEKQGLTWMHNKLNA